MQPQLYPIPVLNSTCLLRSQTVRIPFRELGNNCKLVLTGVSTSLHSHLLVPVPVPVHQGKGKSNRVLLCLHSLSHRLLKSLPADLFEGVRFAIFSLGDRAYGPQKFCAAGRKLTVRLRQLGAVLFTDPGYGDDGTPNGGVFADLDHWLQTALLPQLLTTPATIEDFVTPNPPYRVTVLSQSQNYIDSTMEEWQRDAYAESYRNFFQKQRPLSAYHYDCRTSQRIIHQGSGASTTALLMGRVVENRRITADDWEQNTRHIRLDVAAMAGFGTSNSAANFESPLSSSSSSSTLSRVPWSLESLSYRAGDVASIMPSNTAQEANAFLKVLPTALQALADCELSIQFDPSCCSDVNRFPGVGYPYWPTKCTLRGWLTYCADIHALPEREDLRALATYCSDESSPHARDQRKKLVSLSETKDSALYVDYILREKRSWVDVLYDFDSLRGSGSRLTIETLLGLLAPIRPREFSIASSPTKEWLTRQRPAASAKQEGFGVELCVAVVEGTTRRGRSFHGLCSHYLAQQLPASGDENLGKYVVRLWIRPGSFHGLPLECAIDAQADKGLLQVPVLCVGAGTGVAPLRAMTLEREAVFSLSGAVPFSRLEQEELERDNVLVFGCRKKAADFYYEEEWRSMEHSGRLALLIAFSRDQWHKVYVQQVLGSAEIGSKKLVRHILDKKGAIYIAGGPKMARAVKEMIVESLGTELKGGEKEAHQLLSKLQRMGRYSVEAWN